MIKIRIKFQGGSEDKVYWGDLPDYDKTLLEAIKESLDSSEEASFSPSNNLGGLFIAKVKVLVCD